MLSKNLAWKHTESSDAKKHLSKNAIWVILDFQIQSQQLSGGHTICWERIDELCMQAL